MLDWLNHLDPHWTWLALGLLLAAAEMAIPGVFLIWLAAAAIVTGLVAWLLPIGLAAQVGLFAVLTMAAVFAGKRWLAAHPIVSADPLMNDRVGRLIGEIVVVTTAIADGSGRVRQGDSEWLVRGPDAAMGSKMRIAGHDGSVLIVEHLQ
ncbi:MAG: hypothetical protein RLY97_354 [Pseudomonadota bacterium]